MEETPNTPHDHSQFCQCYSGHGMHGYRRFVLLRWVLGIIILGIVFCVGMKIGQFKGSYGMDGFGGHGGCRGGSRCFIERRYEPGNMMYNMAPQTMPSPTTGVTPTPAPQK